MCLKESVGIADSLYNLRLIRTFCERHLVLKCFHFTYEDLLYGRDNLRENAVVFVAELFFLLEAMKEQEEGSASKEVSADGMLFLLFFNVTVRLFCFLMLISCLDLCYVSTKFCMHVYMKTLLTKTAKSKEFRIVIMKLPKINVTSFQLCLWSFLGYWPSQPA